MDLRSLTRPEWIFPDLRGRDASSVLHVIAHRLADAGLVEDGDELHRLLLEREQLESTGIGEEVAVPHCKIASLDRVVIAVGVCPEGVEYNACDGRPVKVLFVVISPAKSPAAHLQSLAAISKWVRADRHVERVLRQPDREAIYELLGSGVAETSESK